MFLEASFRFGWLDEFDRFGRKRNNYEHWPIYGLAETADVRKRNMKFDELFEELLTG